ncbi:PPR domain-containing protein/PPR_2 domain-containing protein/PPR_3 domain-containing protein, partial [Cephalotus follicularis]
DPRFFREFLRHQNNVLLSLRFFLWLLSYYNVSPDCDSCNVLFYALLEAKACNAAKWFIDHTGFIPDRDHLERYISCLCEGGFVKEAVHVFDNLKGVGVCPSIRTWNSALLVCLKTGRTDLLWKLYGEMMESGVLADVDVETVGYLIRAFCDDGNVSKGYELFRQILEDGLDPGNVAFNKLINGFCKERNYGRVSELLHTMIAKNCAPDIFTYQEVINGLCNQIKGLEGLRIFNDLKDRGYAPDRVMYTTMIHGLCEMGSLGDARKLWFEMFNKGMVPNEYTYNALIHGFWLSLRGRTKKAYFLFKEMMQKGIVRDVLTYNSLIKGFCKEGKIFQSTNLLKELLVESLQPSTSSYTPLIKKL